MPEFLRERSPEEREEERLIRELNLFSVEEDRERRIARENRVSFVEHLLRLKVQRLQPQVRETPRRRGSAFERLEEKNTKRIEGDPAIEVERAKADPCTVALLYLRSATELLEQLNSTSFRQGGMCGWLTEPNRQLGMKTPAALILEGKFGQVREVLASFH